MANPNNAVGTNGAFGGRTSVNAFNDVLSAFSGRGILSGWACSPSSGLIVHLGGDGSTRDVAIAEDAAGNKTTVNNISQSPVEVTLPSAPASNSRIDLIVAYIEDSPNGAGETDNWDVVNVLVVSGTAASTPTAPNDNAIRTAITADGASGATAYYVVLAQITMPTGTTDIDATMISAGEGAALNNGTIGSDQLADGAVTSDKIDLTTFAVAKALLQFGSDASATVTVYRSGNLVWVGESAVVVSLPQGIGSTPISYTCPAGFRPAEDTGLILGNCVDGQHYGSEAVSIIVNNSGEMLRHSVVGISGATRIDFTGCWATADPWPES